MNRRYFLSSSLTLGAFAALSRFPVAGSLVQDADRSQDAQRDSVNAKGIKKVIKTDAEWRQLLTPEQYNEMTFTTRVRLNAPRVRCRCLVRRLSLIPAPVGRVSGRRLTRRMCGKKLITACQ